MPRYTVSVSRTIREDALLEVDANHEQDAEEQARHEVRVGAADFHKVPGSEDLTIDWIQEENREGREFPDERIVDCSCGSVFLPSQGCANEDCPSYGITRGET